MQALYCDEAMDAVEDMLHQTVSTFGLEGEALKAARQKLVDGWLTIFVKGLGEVLERGVLDYAQMTSLPARLREALATELRTALDVLSTPLLARPLQM